MRSRLETVLWTRLARVAEEFGLGEDARAALRSVVESVESILPPALLSEGPLTNSDTHVDISLEPWQVEVTRPVPSEVKVNVPLLGRYQDLGIIGRGGMGEVRRVRDLDLGRTMAMKVLLPGVLQDGGIRARFVEEAQATAQLQHPGIIPVHELGCLPDGRFYFTMKEVRGRTLASVITEVHLASPGVRWEQSPSGWSFRRLIDAFHRVCEAVAYAHSRGVLHRDLKPSNVMVGGFGEVLVMDWGLAKVVGRAELAPVDEPEISTVRSENQSNVTRYGVVAGTPAYMPPEQALGETHKLGPASDVYALGAILYEILSGTAPYQAPTARLVLLEVIDGPPPPPGRRLSNIASETLITGEGFRDEPLPLPGQSRGSEPEVQGPPLPEPLVNICLKAMARTPSERYQDAGELAAEIGSWLEGAKRREQALNVVEEADRLWPEVETQRTLSDQLLQQAQVLKEGLAPTDPVEKKLPGWKLEDEAQKVVRQADLLEIKHLQLLQGALTHEPDLPEAHARLADVYHRRHQQAERLRNTRVAAEWEVLLRSHDHGRYHSYLRGDGTVSLETNPAGAEVTWYQMVEHDRRLVPERRGSLGKTPLRRVRLPMGSHLLTLEYPGYELVKYPVFLERNEHWEGIPPGDILPCPVELPRRGQLGEGEIYVPGGWFWCGGDPDAYSAFPRTRVWVDSFVIQQFPITHQQYLEFLNDLSHQGRLEEALRWAPRQMAGAHGEEGALLYGVDDSGHFFLQADSDGDVWNPDWPVFFVSWFCGLAYARWKCEQTGQPWRLPAELEWEKAGRGVDGRIYPFGDFIDPTWACTLDSHVGRALPQVVDSFPLDVSLYGVRALAGNIRQWCADTYQAGVVPAPESLVVPPSDFEDITSPRMMRGGVWLIRMANARVAGRYWDGPRMRGPIIGFRLVRSFS